MWEVPHRRYPKYRFPWGLLHPHTLTNPLYLAVPIGCRYLEVGT
jgi:hypothetical protein